MPTVCVNQSGCRIRLSGERLEVFGPDPEADPDTDSARDKLLRDIPLRDVDRLIMGDSTHITTPAMSAMLDAGIPIQIFSWSGRCLGSFLPSQNKHGAARLLQYRRALEPAFALEISRRVIHAKLYNQRRVLQRVGAARGLLQAANTAPTLQAPPEPGTLRHTLAWMDALFGSVRNAGSIDELRGYEGASTARYFQAWADFLPAGFPFERRSTRPPLNAVNACVSFGSTIIYNEMVAFLHGHGLDPALGLLHATEDGRWSLALDLMEPFRPVFVEALSLDLFTHQILNDTHFESRNGGVYLNEEGRKKFFVQYERRMERQFMSETLGHRTTLRQQLENQAIDFKSALENPPGFEPFLMN